MGRLAADDFNRLIAQGNSDEVLRLYDENPAEVRRLLTRVTYAPDTPLHAKAIEAFRMLSEERADRDTEFFREIIRRHIWGMNDEGGNIDWSAPEIIAAVIAGSPEHFKEFIPIMYHAALAEPAFHQSLSAALEMLPSQDR